MRVLLSLLGFCSAGCGVIGLFVPVWPSTVFFIVAVALFAKSNPRAERWILEHPTIGRGLSAWQEERAIARPAKIAASIAILLSFGVSVYFIEMLWLRVALSVFGACLILFLCTRPEPRERKPLTESVKGNDAA